MQHTDTIVAVATGVEGSIAILRLSGPDAPRIADRVWHGPPIAAVPPRTLVLGSVLDSDGAAADHCLLVYMPAPRSYTGEDVVEFHCHGGAMVARTLLELLLRAGARHADPGEFTRRAFINGKLDLTQAEAVLDVIQAQSKMALHAANRQLAGTLGRRVDHAYATLTELLAEVEVRMDFVDEELDWESAEVIRQRLGDALADLRELLAHRAEGEILRHGIRLVLAGVPNAGKSSLLNLLLGRDRAIVTEFAGTTRDTLEEFATIRGIPVNLIDTAGIRQATDLVERLGVERSLNAVDQAQIVLWIIDLTADLELQRPPVERFTGKGVILIANKIDLAPDLHPPFGNDIIRLSATIGEGIDQLRDRIESEVWGHPHTAEPEVAVNARHCRHLEVACEQIEQALTIVEEERFELLAVNLRAALNALGLITGKTMQPDILDTVFSKFCIGK